MNDVAETFLSFIRTHAAEVILMTVAVILTAASLVIFILSQRRADMFPQSAALAYSPPSKQMIAVDVSGSVTNPGIYLMSSDSRLNDAVTKAGGLSPEADRGFFARNFNIARRLSDQEKIYIPSVTELQSGQIEEQKHLIDYTAPQNTVSFAQQAQTGDNPLIRINDASLEELETLPGIGPSTAQKIVQGRPYLSLEDLVTKKALKQSVFDQVKTMMSL